MKKAFLFAAVMVIAVLLLPLSQMDKPEGATTRGETAQEEAAPLLPSVQEARTDGFRICDQKTREVTTLSAEAYLFGVVAAEMPANYEPEALKAQAVAAYTYACYRRAGNREKSYDLTNDPALDQSYISEETARERWGEKAEENSKKIKAAVLATKGILISYQGKPVLAVYHAISPGKTETCQNIWGDNAPYLQAVESSWDKLAPSYCTTVSFSAEKLREKLAGECEITGKKSGYFGKSKKTPSGTVEEISVCGTALKGTRVRALLGLRSAAFDVKYEKEQYVFTVYGYGHGVGMSQYGANEMAKQGSGFEEILNHYYTGCTLSR